MRAKLSLLALYLAIQCHVLSLVKLTSSQHKELKLASGRTLPSRTNHKAKKKWASRQQQVVAEAAAEEGNQDIICDRERQKVSSPQYLRLRTPHSTQDKTNWPHSLLDCKRMPQTISNAQRRQRGIWLRRPCTPAESKWLICQVPLTQTACN